MAQGGAGVSGHGRTWVSLGEQERKVVRQLAGGQSCLLRGVSSDLHPLLSFSVDSSRSNSDSLDSRLIILPVCVVWEQTK